MIGKHGEASLGVLQEFVWVQTAKPLETSYTHKFLQNPSIQQELEAIAPIDETNIMGFDHVEFVVKGVKLSFYAAPRKQIPSMRLVAYQHNLRLADVKSIGAMKMETMLRRAKFRDYYDLYSILRSGVNIHELIPVALEHSGHKLKTKNLLAIISNAENFTKDKAFQQLSPIYDVTAKDIEEYIKQALLG